MFSRADDKKRAQESPTANANANASGTAPARRAVDPESPTGTPPSVISESLRITGNLGSKGDIEVNGVVKGDIKCRRLTIGENGTVRGQLSADHVVVDGSVIGRIRAGVVMLGGTAQITADIVTERLAVALGAHFEGHCGRSDDADKPAGTGRGAKTDRPPRHAAMVAPPTPTPAPTPTNASAQAAK